MQLWMLMCSGGQGDLELWSKCDDRGLLKLAAVLPGQGSNPFAPVNASSGFGAPRSATTTSFGAAISASSSAFGTPGASSSGNFNFGSQAASPGTSQLACNERASHEVDHSALKDYARWQQRQVVAILVNERSSGCLQEHLLQLKARPLHPLEGHPSQTISALAWHLAMLGHPHLLNNQVRCMLCRIRSVPDAVLLAKVVCQARIIT